MDSPWSSKDTLKNKDKTERLSKEILDFEKYISPTKDEKLNRDTLLYSITQLVESLWPNNYTITSFGSSVTGLAFPGSDVDVNIDFNELPKNNKIDVLKIIRKQAVNNNIFHFRDTTLAANAKVPVLMAVDENQVSIDITINNECFSSDRTAAWMKEYPALKPLFMVLKQAIGNFRVSSHPVFEPLSAKTAGLASYSLICLIVSYLQLNVSDTMNESNPNYYGILLLGFLSFYSSFDNTTTAIGLSDGGQYYDKKACPIKFEGKAGKLTIVDPDVPGANVGRSTTKFDMIKFIFKYAFDRLSNAINSSSKGESILSSIIKVEHHYHYDPRRQGARFKTEKTYIENGTPKKKAFARNRFGGRFGARDNRRYNNDGVLDSDNYNGRYHNRGKPYERNDRYNRNDDALENDNYTGKYSKSRRGNYKSESYSRRYEDEHDGNAKEYRRHKQNNNHHLAEHYRRKSEKSSRR